MSTALLEPDTFHSSVCFCDLEGKWEICEEEILNQFLVIPCTKAVVLWPYLQRYQTAACCWAGGQWCSLMGTVLKRILWNICECHQMQMYGLLMTTYANLKYPKNISITFVLKQSTGGTSSLWINANHCSVYQGGRFLLQALIFLLKDYCRQWQNTCHNYKTLLCVLRAESNCIYRSVFYSLKYAIKIKYVLSFVNQIQDVKLHKSLRVPAIYRCGCRVSESDVPCFPIPKI